MLTVYYHFGHFKKHQQKKTNYRKQTIFVYGDVSVLFSNIGCAMVRCRYKHNRFTWWALNSVSSTSNVMLLLDKMKKKTKKNHSVGTFPKSNRTNHRKRQNLYPNTFLALYMHFNKKFRGYASFIDAKPPLSEMMK